LSFLLDTNVLSELNKKLPEPKVAAWFQSQAISDCYLSLITIGEIEQGIAALRDEARAASLEKWLETTVKPRFAGRILPIDEGVIQRWGKLMGNAQKQGQPLSAIDTMIAATALEHDLTLVTRNITDVNRVSVKLFNPWQ
jgi:predicted nucleic acid-binding protein